MTEASTIKALSQQRDDAQAKVRDLLHQLAVAEDEMSHLRHFKSGIERMIRNMGSKL